MNKYVVDLRWRNPSKVKSLYLIDRWQKDSFMEAFYFAKDLCEKIDGEHFIEIREENSGEKVASFNEKNV